MLEFIKEFWENDKGVNKKIMLYKKGDGFVLKTLIYNKKKSVSQRDSRNSKIWYNRMVKGGRNEII